jgi:hypothetical protein
VNRSSPSELDPDWAAMAEKLNASARCVDAKGASQPAIAVLGGQATVEPQLLKLFESLAGRGGDERRARIAARILRTLGYMALVEPAVRRSPETIIDRAKQLKRKHDEAMQHLVTVARHLAPAGTDRDTAERVVKHVAALEAIGIEQLIRREMSGPLGFLKQRRDLSRKGLVRDPEGRFALLCARELLTLIPKDARRRGSLVVNFLALADIHVDSSAVRKIMGRSKP